MAFCLLKAMKTASIQQLLSMEASPSPLSSRAQPRDLQFCGILLEMFFDTAERSREPALTEVEWGSAVSLTRQNYGRLRDSPLHYAQDGCNLEKQQGKCCPGIPGPGVFQSRTYSNH